MNRINATIWYNKAEKDWTIEIDGKTHSHLSATETEELLEYTMVAAEQWIQTPIRSMINQSSGFSFEIRRADTCRFDDI